MITALFGASCTGKTTIARALAVELKLPLRSCGDAVRSRARDLSIPWFNLPDEQHRAVDEETRTWCASTQPCIVEGRFLDSVLVPLQDDTVLIQLLASKATRCARWASRAGGPCRPEEIDAHDEADRRFRMRMYDSREIFLPALVINTSRGSIRACAQRVKFLLKTGGEQRA